MRIRDRALTMPGHPENQPFPTNHPIRLSLSVNDSGVQFDSTNITKITLTLFVIKIFAGRQWMGTVSLECSPPEFKLP